MPGTVKRRSTKRKTSTRKTGLSARNKLILKALLGATGAGALGYGGYKAYKSGVSSPYFSKLRTTKFNGSDLFGVKKQDLVAKTGGKRRTMRRMMW